MDHKETGKSLPTNVTDRKTCARVISSRLGKFAAGTFEYSLDKLRELISDPVTRESESWIRRLLDDFLRSVEDDGYVSLKSLNIFLSRLR